MQRLHKLETEHCSLLAGLGPGCISNPNPSSKGEPCVETHSPDEHSHSTHQPPIKCGGMELPLPHPKGYEPEKAQPTPSVGKARPTTLTALMAVQQSGGWPSYRDVVRGRPAYRAGSQPCTLKSCDDLFPSDEVRDWSLAQLEHTGDDVGQKLAQSFDSVGAKLRDSHDSRSGLL